MSQEVTVKIICILIMIGRIINISVTTGKTITMENEVG
jgi:hypothetical protein